MTTFNNKKGEEQALQDMTARETALIQDMTARETALKQLGIEDRFEFADHTKIYNASNFFRECAPTNWRKLQGKRWLTGSPREDDPHRRRDATELIEFLTVNFFLRTDVQWCHCASWSPNSKLFARNIHISESQIFNIHFALLRLKFTCNQILWIPFRIPLVDPGSV